MKFVYERVVRFGDTDAAGVVFFARVAEFCHEAYEEGLRGSGVDVRGFFSAAGEVKVPVVRCEVDFLKGLFAGDVVEVRVGAEEVGVDEFVLGFELVREGVPVARARTRHVCVAKGGGRVELPAGVREWLAALNV